jgi:hypothetical protein
MGLFYGMPPTLEEYNPDENLLSFANSKTVDGKGHYHSYDDQPSVVEFNSAGDKVLMWHSHGLLSRSEGKPPLIVVSYSSYETFNELKILHSYNGMPSEIKNYSAAGAFEFTWHKEGIFHHEEDKPALISTRKRTITALAYYQNGIIHRDNNKPASLTKYSKSCWLNGVLHNSEGPAEYSNEIEKKILPIQEWSLYGVYIPEKVFNSTLAIQKDKNIPLWLAFLCSIEAITDKEVAAFLDESFSSYDTLPMKWILRSWGVTDEIYSNKIKEAQTGEIAKRRTNYLDTLIQVIEFEKSKKL